MKRWEHYFKEVLVPQLYTNYEKFSKTGRCDSVFCSKCPLNGLDCQYRDEEMVENTVPKRIKLLNEEI